MPDDSESAIPFRTDGDVETTAPLPKVKTAAQKVRDWLREQIKGKDEVQAPALARQALKDLGHDEEFLLELGRERLQEMVYRETLKIISGTRFPMAEIEQVQTPEEIQQQVAVLEKKFERWLEHSGNRHVVLTAMTYSDLVASVAERRRQVAPQMAMIDFEVALARRLRGTKKTVGEVLTTEEIESIRQASLKKYKVAA